MPSVEWSAPETDPEQAVGFLEDWTGTLPEDAGGGRRWMTITSLPMSRAVGGAYSDVVGGLESGVLGLNELTYPPDARKPQGLYHCVGVTKERPPQGYRGKERDVDRIPGAWADLDVRDGSFRNWDHILELLSRMRSEGMGPDIVVATGSGGAHLYWKQHGGFEPEVALHYSKRIRRWIMAEFGVKVDNVAQANRIMRLPGSLRFPKNSSDLSLGVVPVEVVSSTGRFADFGMIKEVTEAAWSVVEERTREQRDRMASDFYAVADVALTELEYQGILPGSDGVDLSTFFPSGRSGLALDGSSDRAEWDELWGKFAFLEVFNRSVPWAAILEPAGWTKFGEPDDEGRQSWTRPGGGAKNPRSAITDWDGGPNVMSLLSDAPETGLSHLYEIADDATRRVFKLTKARVLAELKYDGSMEKLIGTWLAGHRGTGW